MNRNAPTIVAIITGISLLLGGSIAAVAMSQDQVIMEDDPRFDCATMGNRVCGPSTYVNG